jgi:3-oxoacyl-[acyl-carrier-protein] synthase-1
MSQDPAIVGVGMMTAVGLSAAETAAAVRAGAMRFTETPIRDHRFEPFTLALVPDDGLPPLADSLQQAPGLSSREIRMLRLVTGPIAECLASVPPSQRPTGLILALPETKTRRQFDAAAFISHVLKQCGGQLDARRTGATDIVGRAGGLVAIASAAELIRNGQANFMIAGGVDTYRDLYVLGTLDLEKRVKSSVHLDGFIPGEAAAFVLLASASAAAAANLKPLASVTRAAHGVEVGHLYSDQPYRGDGLAATVTQLVDAGVVRGPIAEVWSSMNGENHWAKEWGVTFLRNQAAFLEGHRIHHPADCFGDTGAACGPALVGLQALGMRASYRQAPALIYCSSDSGPRAALAVNAAT